MIPDPTDFTGTNPPQSPLDNQDRLTSSPSQEIELAKELFISLYSHASATQNLADKELISWLPVFDEDCKKVHLFCQKILNNEALGNEFLPKMSTYLLQMATQLEIAEKSNPSKIRKNVLNNIYSEINEIQKTILIRSSLDLREQLQDEFSVQTPKMPSMESVMQPLSGWHFQNIPASNFIASTSSPWKLDSLKNISVAALYALGSSALPTLASTLGASEDTPQTPGLHHNQFEQVNTSALPTPLANIDRTFHTHEPLMNVNVRKLQQTVISAENALESTSPLPIWPSQGGENEQSFELADLEQTIGRLMDEARQFLSQENVDAANCGTKHLNLVKQAQLVAGLKLKGVVVPFPHAVSSDKVTQFLQKTVPEIFQEWVKLGRLFENYQKKTPFTQETEVQEHLNVIDQLIEKAFIAAGDNEFLFKYLVPQDFIQWLNTIKKNDNYLMVRSTGSEDTRESANAGGNASPHYVSPTAPALSKAMGEVVRSYFSFNSLQNRINAKMNPFKSDLKLAVTAQELIGEPIGGATNPKEIPISLVLFTSEPVYVGGEKFRAMRISATYGHGEGVVGNQGIATDTALILISEAHPDKLYIMYDNQEKTERLAPVQTSEGIKLRKVPNHPSMQNRPALNEAILNRLYLWGVLGEKFFDNYPTDMEIVVKGNTIFPVQARPVNRPDLLPTFLDPKKIAALGENPITQTIQGEVIVPGQGSALILDNAAEILFAPALKEAEDAFQKGLHKLVIVTHPEPANSHPVVNFSGLGIPCLLMPQGVQDLLSGMDQEHLIAADIQKGVLNLWDNRLGSAEACISKGFAVHPAKIAISLPMSATLPIRQEGQEAPQEIKDLILEIRGAATHAIALSKLNELRQHGWLQNIKQLEQKLKSHLQNMEFVPIQLSQGLALSTQLIEKIESAISEAEAALKRHSEETLRPLLHAKVIENLLVNSPASGKSLGHYSMVDIKPLHTDLKSLVDYQQALRHPAHFADLFMLGSQGVVAASEIEWRAFLKDLEPLVQAGEISSEQVTQFKVMLHTLEATGLLPTWYTMYFPKASGSAKNKFESLLETFPPDEKSFLNQFLDIHGNLMTNQKFDQFTDPKSFDEGWNRLQSIVKQFHLHTEEGYPSSFAEQLKNCSPLTKTVVLKVMQQLVDTYDLSIKAMKKSSAWQPEEQVLLFKKMLKPYLDLLLDWGRNIITIESSTSFPEHEDWPLSNYLNEMETIFDNLSDQDPASLRPSNGFNVAAAKYGSATVFSNNFPVHLEDMFTLIHQNLLTLLGGVGSQLYDANTLQHAFLPDLLKAAVSSLENTVIVGNKMQRIGLEINTEGALIKYNIPLRDHSAQAWLQYNKISNEINFKGTLFGFNELNRWGANSLLLKILDKFAILPLSEDVQSSDKEIKFSWKISDPKAIPAALEEWDILIDTSFKLSVGTKEKSTIIKDLIKRRHISKLELTKFWKTFNVKKDFKIILIHELLIELLQQNNNQENLMLIKAAQLGQVDPDWHIRLMSTDLFRVLFEKGLGQEAAEAVAILGVKNSNNGIQRSALNLFDALFNKGMGHKAAEALLNEDISDPNLQIHYKPEDLSKALSRKVYGK